MDVANQPTPPPAASLEGVGQGWSLRVLYNYADWPRKKIISKPNNFILIFMSSQLLLVPKWWNQTPCVLPPSLTSSPMYTPPRPHVFGWLLCAPSSIGGHLRPGVFYFYYFCVAQFNNRGVETASSHTLYHRRASFPMLIQPLPSTTSWLLGIFIDWRPPKAKATPIALFFDGVCVSTPNKGASSHERESTTGRLQRTHSKPLCLDLRPWQMLPWQKMAKPLEGRVAAAHLGYCVFCVFCALCCVRAAFNSLSAMDGCDRPL